MEDPLFAPMADAEHLTFGPVEIDVQSVGDARVKRMIYPPGMRWSTDLKPMAGTGWCEHAHAGFLAHGTLHFEFEDGCALEYAAPAVVAVPPGHDAWVVGEEHAVLIEIDYLGETVSRVGLASAHHHD